MPKKKVIAARNLNDWTKFTTQIKDKTKKKSVLLTRHLCASRKRLLYFSMRDCLGLVSHKSWFSSQQQHLLQFSVCLLRFSQPQELVQFSSSSTALCWLVKCCLLAQVQLVAARPALVLTLRFSQQQPDLLQFSRLVLVSSSQTCFSSHTQVQSVAVTPASVLILRFSQQQQHLLIALESVSASASRYIRSLFAYSTCVLSADS